MGCGVAAGWLGLLKSSHSEVLNRFVFSLAMPAFIFISLSRVPADDFFDIPYLTALAGGMFSCLFIGFLVARFVFARSASAAGIQSLCAMYSSTGYIGLPLVLLLFGDDALVPGVIGAVITGGVFMPLGILLAELDAAPSHRSNLTAPLVAVARNPVIIATVAGLTCSGLAIEVAEPVAKFCDLVGQAYIPCSLFAAGLFLAGAPKVKNSPEVIWLLAVKLLVHPAITYWIAVDWLNLSGMILTIVVLQAALPTGVPVFVLAQAYRVQMATANMAVVASTVCSLITLSIILFLFGL